MTDETRFFTYGQNNSGGVFDLTDDVTHWVIIEAVSAAASTTSPASCRSGRVTGETASSGGRDE